MEVVSRIDRDYRPLGFDTNPAGGPVNEYPIMRDGWSGSTFGDIYVGGKFNILSEYAQNDLALAIRGIVKLPTGSSDVDKGTSTGKADFIADLIVSKEINKAFELSAYGGFAFRGSPDLKDSGGRRRDLEQWTLGLRLRRPDARRAAPDGRALRREALRRHAHRHREHRRRPADALHVAEPQPGRVHARRHVDQPERLVRRRRRDDQLRPRRPQQLRLRLRGRRRRQHGRAVPAWATTPACAPTCRRRPRRRRRRR